MKMEQSVLKHWRTKFRRRGITQKKAYNKIETTCELCLPIHLSDSSNSIQSILLILTEFLWKDSTKLNLSTFILFFIWFRAILLKDLNEPNASFFRALGKILKV